MCGDRCTQFAYKCSENCAFYMDMKCVILLPTIYLVVKLKKLHHAHPLFVCQRKLLLDCSNSSVAAAFGCGGCSLSFDISEEPHHLCLPWMSCVTSWIMCSFTPRDSASPPPPTLSCYYSHLSSFWRILHQLHHLRYIYQVRTSAKSTKIEYNYFQDQLISSD